MRSRPTTPSLVLAVALFASATAPAVRAADSNMDKTAALVSDAIAHAKLKTVIVFDFAGPDYKVTALGRSLADDFNASLEKSAATFSVESRSQVTTAIANNQFALVSENAGASMRAFAQHLGTQAFVMAQLSIAHDQLSVLLSCFRTRDGKALKIIRVTSPFTLEESELDATDLAAEGFDSYPKPGKNGYSLPMCISCPRADYTLPAMQNKIQGTVILEVIVQADGTVGEIRVIHSLPYGLTESAIWTVKQWRLKPATKPDGKPAAVREVIAVQFRAA